MTVTVKHSKTNAISDWTQAQLDEQIALGNFAEGTVLADIVLPSDWNDDHTLTGLGTMAEQNANSVAITGGSINGTTIGATTASTGRFTSVTTPSVTATTNDLTLSAISTGNINLNTPNGTAFRVLPVSATSSNWLQVGNPSTTVIRLGPAGTTVADFRILAPTFTSFHTGSSADGLSDGSQQFRVSNTASAVNYVQVTGAATGGQPTISAQGSDTNIPLRVRSKGTGYISLENGGGASQLIVLSGGSNNYTTVTGTNTGSAPIFGVAGSDTNIGLSLTTKGTGAVRFNTGGGEQFRVADTFAGGTATNYIQVQGRASFQPVLSTAGASTNIPLQISTKGTGDFSVWTNGGAQQQFSVTHTASAVNYVQVTGSATGATPAISAQGSDANINLLLNPKGTGQLNVFINNGSQFRVSNTASAVNYLEAKGNIASNAPSLSSQGSDTNIDLTLTPKGTGVVQFGTHTANADTAISGYITIRDAGGTLRKLAVIT